MFLARLRRVALPAAFLISTSFLPVPGSAQTTAECTGSGTETNGPTDITGVSGNRRMSAAINAEGTVTVLRWPSPSYYDQIKYRTTDRSEPHMGSLPNEGAFIGLAWRRPNGEEWRFVWMRDVLEDDAWTVRQDFTDDDGDELRTRYSNPGVGLTVTLRDVVAPTRDALLRRVTVTRHDGSPGLRARLFSFANFNPVFSKQRQAPYEDWCDEEDNDSGARYDNDSDAIVAARSGTDASTGDPSSVALAMGFVDGSDQHHVGTDTYETGAGGTSAYDDASDGELTGDSEASGQADGALAVDLDLRSTRVRDASIVIATGATEPAALRALESIRDSSAGAVARAKAAWWRSWLKTTRMPRGAPRAVTDLAKRALISMRQATDPNGMIVSSIATQPSFSLDWVRDGAHVNRALRAAGFGDMARRHSLHYADLQATAASKAPGGEATPAGNWSDGFYADGVVGGPTPYAIDETGLGLWALWDHYVQTQNADYFFDAYEAIQRGAQYLTDVCRDPTTGLQCAAPESNESGSSRTLRGAQAVWLGLDSAARAARERAELDPSGREVALDNAAKWRARADEIADAILENYHDDECSCFTEDPRVGGAFLWPVRALDLAGSAPGNQAEANWRAIRPAIEGRTVAGGMESQTVLGNSYLWAGTSNERRLERALRWIATVPTTNGTGLLGSEWAASPSRIVTMQGQPHVPSLAMFYLAALRTYGSERWSPR
jgi:hypothetical protein